MNREEAIKVLESSDMFWIRPTEDEKMAITMAIEALQSETHDKRTDTQAVCSDLISRGEAIYKLYATPGKNLINREDAIKRLNEIPMALQSADRSEPGRWELVPDTDEYGLKRAKLVCSKCKKEPAAWDLTELFAYCPNCGTEMGGNTDEE